jgi:CHAD domain-containing protein
MAGQKKRPDPEQVRAFVRGQLDSVSQALDRADERSVHEARKAFKRVRAAVRLSRDELGDDVRRRENAAFRDAGRELSGARDAQVLVETLDKLDAEGFAGLRAVLAAEDAPPPDTAAVRAAVDDARERVKTWPLNGEGSATLASGIARIQRRGRRAYRAAREDPSTEHLHDLRKRTKDLWHAAQILRPADPKRMDELAKSAHKLADLLGDDHDLATLSEVAERHRATLTPAELERLGALIAERRGRLQRKAMRRASDLYAIKPKKLAKTVS